jgi:pimeloyl-ACP methyl ester carboxylesterase
VTRPFCWLRHTVIAVVLGTPAFALAAADPFLCYKAKADPRVAATDVALSDAIDGDTTVSVKKLQWICNPVDMDGAGIADANTHLDAYKVKLATGQTAHVPRVGLGTADAFGELSLDTKKADLLLVPSTKCIDTPPGTCPEPLPAPDPALHRVDHFKCFKAKVTKDTPKFVKTTATLADQFVPLGKMFDVKKPKHYCVPVSKNGEPVKDATNPLLCYKAKPASGAAKHTPLTTVKVSDQLGSATLETKKEAELCVPLTTVVGETINIASAAEPPNTPGTTGVTVTNPKLLAQFGGGSFTLNQARYTRFHFDDPSLTPQAILVLVPGFEGGANDFKLLGENLLPRVLRDHGTVIEVWAFDRRTNQLEDTVGLDIAEQAEDALVGLDWLFGGELSLTLHPLLVAGPNRRAEFYDTQGDIPFLAGWTNLVFSRDIDAVVEAARAVVGDRVYLGGHSAGTGFAARYAATDFNLTGVGPADPGFGKLRGLVLLEGGGGSTSGAPLTTDTLDRIEAKFDGGLFGAVRDNAPRCVDGLTACTVANEAVDCAAFTNTKCTLPTTAYAVVPGLLNARILAAVEPAAIQGINDPDTGQIILQVNQGGPGNNAVAQVPQLLTLGALPQATVQGGIGSFIDDEGLGAVASFVATSVGATGPVVGSLTTWLDNTEPLPASVLPNNGPAPTTVPAAKWGVEVEPTRFDRMLTTFYAGGSNFTDWYYPQAGPSTTSVTGECSAGTCIVGNVGAMCTSNGQCSQSVNLDSTALSVGRGRRDIENLTQAAAIDIPVIGFGGSNGLAPAPSTFVAFGNSIAPCAAPSCNGTARVVDAALPNPAFPTLGGVNGGFEVHISVGYSHVDVLTAEDDSTNNVLGPLSDFIARNLP